MKTPQTQQHIKLGISRLQERIESLGAFSFEGLTSRSMADMTALSAAISDTLERSFGKDTTAFQRYKPAIELRPKRAESYANDFYFREESRENIQRSIALLKDAQRALREDLEDAEYVATTHAATTLITENVPPPRRVFVVHGHDAEARETIARFLQAIDFEPIILHEQANKGSTVIEKFEENSDVGFAVVLLTPDDMGRSKNEENLKPRARQNVLLELGYFIGRLGRDKVCAFKRGEVEIPSDYVGVVWESMDTGAEWKRSLCRELVAAGFEIDSKKAFYS